MDGLDGRFCDAVAAIDAGDVAGLERILAVDPMLPGARLDEPGSWLREKVGNAIDRGQFFERPYLLWFVAEDPVRNSRLPHNIADVAGTIIRAAARFSPETLQHQLSYALELVSLSWIARDCGVQIALIDTLIDAGASPDGHPEHALVNGNFAAAEHLVKRGAVLTLATALCLNRFDDASPLFASADDRQKQFAVVVAALHGRVDALRWLIRAGVDVNRTSDDLFSHATPLHHAVGSGVLPAVRVLAEAGAAMDMKDTAWGATPLGWAEYYIRERNDNEKRKRYGEIAAYLRQNGARS